MPPPDQFDIYNDTDDPLPAGGLCQWAGGVTSKGAVKVVKPTAASAANLIVCGPHGIAPRSAGLGTFAPAVVVAFDPTAGTPAVGDALGSQVGSFLAKKGNTGFVCYGGAAGPWALCARDSRGGSGLAVEENDGSPSYSGITTLRFDQADGFTITNPSAGVARVDFTGVTGSGTGYRLVYWSPSSSTALLSSGIDTVDGNSVRAPGVGRFGGNLTAGFGTDFTAAFDLGSGFLASLLLTAESRSLKIEIPGSTLPSTVAQLRATGLSTVRLDGAAYDTTVGYFVGGVAGVTGTTAGGDTVVGGILTAIGGGSYVSTAGANTFTNQNTFQPATAATVPQTVQGAASQTANLTEWKNSGGSVLASVSAAGVLTAAALNGTYDAGTW